MNTNKEKTPILDKKTALLKAESWCAYQERSQQETRNKLYDFGLYPTDVEDIITTLILTNFLSEERFAFAYVSGKVNIKKWGKIKIKQGLKLKRVPDKLIQKALNSVDYDLYLKNLQRLAEKKLAILSEKNPLKRKYKLNTYLLSKGYEIDCINEVLKTNELY